MYIYPDTQRTTNLWGDVPWQAHVKDTPQVLDTLSAQTGAGSDAHGVIQTKLDEIIAYGTGYSDALSSIAIPLIIALCAFTFPFIFSIINDINNKYKSKVITQLFESSWPYRFFLASVVFALVYLLLLASFTLAAPTELFLSLQCFMNWTTVVLAAVFSAIIVRFVFYCIRFNRGAEVARIVEQRVRRDRRYARWQMCRVMLKAKQKTFFDRKNKVKNDFYTIGVRQTDAWSDYNVEKSFVDRSVDICKYAIRKQDYSALMQALAGMDGVFKKEKEQVNNRYGRSIGGLTEGCPHRLTMAFFEEVFPYLVATEREWDVEDTLLWDLFGVFKKCDFVGAVDMFWLTRCLRKVVDAGGERLIEKYIDKSRYSFGTLSRLHRVAYIKGEMSDEYDKVVKESQENWKQLCNYHFLLLAYAYSKGHEYVVKEGLRGRTYGGKSLYPTTQCDLLIRYHECMQIADKGRWESGLDRVYKLFGKRLDVGSMLNKYLVAAMKLAEKHGNEEMADTPATLEEVLKDYRDDLVRIADKDFGKAFDKAVETIVHQNDPYWRYDKTWKDDVKEFVKGLFCKTNDVTNFYIQPLNETLKTEFRTLQRQCEQVMSRRLPDRLFGTITNEKNETVTIGTYKLSVNKLFLTIRDYYDAWMPSVISEIDEVIESRVMYAALTALHNMRVKEERISVPKLTALLADIVGNKPEDYVIVNFESHMDVFLPPDGTYGHYSFQGMPYIEVHSTSFRDLADLGHWTEFEQSLVVMKKDDLPCLAKETEESAEWATFKDVADEAKGIMLAEIAVNPNKVVRYSQRAKVVKIVTVPEKI